MTTAQPSTPRVAGRGAIRVRASALLRRAPLRRLARSRQVDFWMRELAPAWSLDAPRASVVDIIDETPDVRTFVLAPNALWPGHRAGQFVRVAVVVDGVRTERCYSISSAPGDPRVAITVKRVPGGRVSTWMHAHVHHGDVLDLSAPAGELVVPSDARGKLLLLSGGSGVTPLMSILRDLAARGAVRDVVLVHAARTKDDVIFARDLERLALRHAGLTVRFVFGDDVDRKRRRLDPDMLARLVPDFLDRTTLLCAPEGMTAALAVAWSRANLGGRLLTERFTPAPRLAPPSTDAPEKVRLALVRAGRTVETDGPGTLLEQLERAGERPESGCRMGICHTCVCKKRAGVVENVVTGELSTEPEEDIRLCVSRARTDLELAL